MSENEWLTLLVIMTDAAEALPAGELSANLSAQDVVAREEQSSEDIDAAVRAFSRQGHWPKLSVEESFFLHQRLRFGLHIANVLATPDKSKPTPKPSIFPNPPPEFSTDVQLEWLLIDGWNHEGRQAWRGRLLGQEPLY